MISECPDKVWIGTVEYAIHIVPRDDPKLDGGETDGITEFDPTQITISGSLSLTGFMETMWHELTHAINDTVGIEDGSLEEDIADRHGKAWSQFWINNPTFQRWWTKACTSVRGDRAKPLKKRANADSGWRKALRED
jgi:hypothetical protein